MRVLMPSIIDPSSQLGGAWTATRTILGLLHSPPFDAEVVSLPCVKHTRAEHHLRRCVAFTKSLFSGLPAKFQFQYSAEVLKRMRSLLREQHFDLILLNGSDLLWMLPELPPESSKILIAHNIEHHLYASQIETLYPRTCLSKRLLWADLNRLRNHELAGLSAVGNVIFLSTEDESYARAACAGLNTITLPPLLARPAANRPADVAHSSELRIGMLANFEWWPSQQGIQWFLREVLPRVRSQMSLHLYGKGSENLAKDQPRVVCHGYVPDPEIVWANCHFMICPVFAGGGVSIKFLEAIARGIPVLATNFAARGLRLEPDPAIQLRDTAAEWIAFLNSDAAWQFGRSTPSPGNVDHFLPDNHVRRLCGFLQKVRADLP